MEQASWVGLSLQEAMRKQWEIEKEQKIYDVSLNVLSL